MADSLTGNVERAAVGRTINGQITLNGTPIGNVRDITPVTACPTPAP